MWGGGGCPHPLGVRGGCAVRTRLPLFALVATVATLALSLGAAADASAQATTGPPATARVFRPVGWPQLHGAAAPASSPNNLAYRGGSVFTTPAIYIIYWGPQWASGFSTGGYSSGQAQTYVHSFFGGVGGSSWLNSQMQYCQGAAVGTQFCSGGQRVTNPAGQLKGTWNDTTSVPAFPSDAQVQAAARRGASHFGYSASALYMVVTPHNHNTLGFGLQWCAYHDNSTFGGRPLAYANLPYNPDAGTLCGRNFVNRSNNSFGNGYFDGFSMVAGHEYAEAATDAFPSQTLAWVDSSGNETGDKCAWNGGPGPQSASRNITLGGHSFAVQSLWSNTANGNTSGCVISG